MLDFPVAGQAATGHVTKFLLCLIHCIFHKYLTGTSVEHFGNRPLLPHWASKRILTQGERLLIEYYSGEKVAAQLTYNNLEYRNCFGGMERND